MRSTTRSAMMWSAVLAVAVTAAAACGDDDAETAAEYGARIDTECPGEDPGFDAFMTEHPEPTAEDWARFLPQPTEMLTTLAACISDSDPPAELQDGIDAVVAAMHVVIDDFDNALAAAEAGDLDETERWIGQMHDVDQPKIDEAIEAVMAQAG
jgi:hypothetical protein